MTGARLVRRSRSRLAAAATASVVLAVLLCTGTAAGASAATAVGALSQLRGKAGCVAMRPGPLTPGCARARLLGQTLSVAVSADGRSVYTVSPGFGSASLGGGVAVFARNTRTGALRQLRGRRGCVNRRGRAGCARAPTLGRVWTVTLSPDGRNVYASYGSSGGRPDAVAIFARDRRSGALRLLRGGKGCVSANGGRGCARGRALSNPGPLSFQTDVATSPDGRTAYVLSESGVAVFARDRRTGALTQLPGATGCVNRDASDGCGRARGLFVPRSVAVSADGSSAYIASTERVDAGGGPGARSSVDVAVAVFARDPVTGGLTQRPGEAGCVERDPGEGCARGRFGDPQVDPTIGATDVVVSPDGRGVYLAYQSSFPGDERPSGSIAVFWRDPATGGLAQLAGEAGSVGLFGDGVGLAISSDGRSLYGASGVAEVIDVFARDPASGALARLGGRAGCVSRGGTRCTRARGLDISASLALSPDGRSAYVASGTAVAVFARVRASRR